MICGNTMVLTGFGGLVLSTAISFLFMALKELQRFQTFQDLEENRQHGLMVAIIFGCLEVLDMLPLATQVYWKFTQSNYFKVV